MFYSALYDPVTELEEKTIISKTTISFDDGYLTVNYILKRVHLMENITIIK